MSDFYMIQRLYENRPENDSTALPFVDKLLHKAKSEQNLNQLFRGYNDARFFTPDPYDKLKYADSAILVATTLKDDKLLSRAYLSKGIVYYFNFKKYKLALNEYLKAFEKNDSDSDPYYRNKIRYHIGVVRSYIGLHEDALEEFKRNRSFFEGQIKKDMHPNLMFGNQRGYYNTLHQMAVCYRNLHNYRLADSIVSVGLANTLKNEDFKQEHSYFLKEQGISKYRNKDYQGAIKTLELSLPALQDINDFAWITVVYSYLGKSKWQLGNFEDAIKDYEKIDSIFIKYSFVLPEVSPVYQDLIRYYSEKNNSAKSAYYSSQSSKVDKVLENNFVYLSPKIYRRYDAEKLLKETKERERQISANVWISIVVIFTTIFMLFYMMLRIRSSRKGIGNSRFLGINLGVAEPEPKTEGTYRVRTYLKTDIDGSLERDILNKLAEFEKNNGFLELNLDLKKMAEKFGVSSNNLSEVIHAHRNASFTLYLSELRIFYITEKLRYDDTYLKYKSEALAIKCGINTRQTLSRLFREINGIHLEKFLKERRRELEKKTN